jgi:hypothetical protein
MGNIATRMPSDTAGERRAVILAPAAALGKTAAPIFTPRTAAGSLPGSDPPPNHGVDMGQNNFATTPAASISVAATNNQVH